TRTELPLGGIRGASAEVRAVGSGDSYWVRRADRDAGAGATAERRKSVRRWRRVGRTKGWARQPAAQRVYARAAAPRLPDVARRHVPRARTKAVESSAKD